MQALAPAGLRRHPAGAAERPEGMCRNGAQSASGRERVTPEPDDLPVQSLSPPARHLLAAVLTVAMAASLTGVFVSLFLYVSSGRVTTMALYALGMYAGIGLTSVWAGGLPHRIPPRSLFSAGVGLTAGLYALLLVLGPAAAGLVLPLGLLSGVAGGVYWFSVNTLMYDLLPPRERMLYYATSQALTAVGGVVLPLVAGLVIARLAGGLGYETVFAAALALYLVALLLSRRLPRGAAVGGLPVALALRLVRDRPRYRRQWLAVGLRGTRDVTGGFVLVALIYLQTGSAGGLAVYTAAAALAGALGALLLRRLPPRRERPTMWLGAVACLAAASLLLRADYGAGGLIVFQVATAFFTPLYQVPIATRVLRAMDEDADASRTRASYVLSRELAVNAGRLLAIGGVLLLIGRLGLAQALVLSTVAAAVIQVGAVWLSDLPSPKAGLPDLAESKGVPAT